MQISSLIATTERPILMNGTMVRAALDGTKTQTRRPVKPAPEMVTNQRIEPWTGDPAALLQLLQAANRSCPYGKAGDHLWVRETFGFVSHDEHQRPLSECSIEYRADLPVSCNDRPGGWPVSECAGDPQRPRWRPSIHMPRSASRILLENVSVRVERLNDCSDADARAEGTPGGHGVIPSYNYNATPSEHYSHLWESINGAGSWAANPWVWVIEFKRVAT
jgi:hypothetical protein